MNKVSVTFAILVIWIFSPILFMLFNIGGFIEINEELLNTIIVEEQDFNPLSLSGFGTMFKFLFSLAKYSIFSNSIVVVVFYTFMTAITVVDIILITRGGGS